MTKPSEALLQRLQVTDEERASIASKLSDPNWEPRAVEWADPGPDPFGREWDWLEEADSHGPALEHPVSVSPTGSPSVIPLVPPGRTRTWRRPALWAGGLAASLLLAVGTWAAVRSSRVPLTEQDVTAWVSRRLEPGGAGVHIAAPAQGDEQAEEPLINRIDRPGDVERPAAPNVYAPLRVQEQLVIPEVTEPVDPGQAMSRPLKTVVETVRPGSIFYLEFSPASTPSPGTAVVVRTAPGAWRLLRDEVMVRPADGTCYFGPLKMGDAGAEYLVLLADKSSAPLLATVSQVLPKGDQVDPETWKARVTAALRDAGHSWFSMQRIATRPEAGQTPR